MGASDEIEVAMLETLERIKERIAENINAKGLKASGKTERSMRIERDAFGMQLIGRPYFQSLEVGRPAGRVPRNFNGIIRQWIIDKGLRIRTIPYKRLPSERWQPKYSVEERSLRIMAGAIAHTIATRGTRLYRQGGRKDIYTPVIAVEVEELKKKFVNIVVNSISSALSASNRTGQ